MDLEQMNEKLLACPFCGGKAYIKRGEIWRAPFYRAECSVCHCVTNMIMVGYNLFTKTTTTEQEAMQEAARRWNRTYTRDSAAEGDAV